MDDLKSENPARNGTDPISEKIIRGIAREIERKQDRKPNYLKQYVGEKDRKLPVKLAPIHDSS
jgi:hypothetical protein